MIKLVKMQISLLAMLAIVISFQSNAFAKFDVDWGRSSDNGHKGYKDIGIWLVNNGYYSNQKDAEKFAKNNYIGHDKSDADPFLWSAGNNNTFTIVQELASYKNQNLLGYYLAGDPTSKTSIFPSGIDNGPVSLAISGDFGLYLNTPEKNFWYTDKTKNTCNSVQALIYELKPNQEWLIAWEDLYSKSRKSDNDYNDMFVKLSIAPIVTPEPVSSALFLLGSGALVAIKRSRSKKA